MSYMIRGVVVGVKEVVKRDKEGNRYSKTFIGFQTPKANGFEGEVETKTVQVSKDQLAKGLPAYYEQIKGQEVLAPVFIMPWSNGGGFTTFFEGEGKAVSVSAITKKAA